ncbi:MAG: tetratricopeptide repeat-containing sensor histidine kinase [Alphaproteobacteria bacterium]|nr:tetratricopeptide repeat-containing sensor histidine kinase [Alphaproteobacteria bacterium]
MRCFLKLFALCTLSFLLFCHNGCIDRSKRDADLVVKSRLVDSIIILHKNALTLRVTDPTKALACASDALALATSAQSDSLIIKGLNVKGLVLYSCSNDSAGFYLNQAMQWSDSTGITFERGGIFLNLACLSLDANDYENAIIQLDSSIHSSYRLGQISLLASALTVVTSVYAATHDTANEKLYTDSVYKLSARYQLKREWAISYGNLARFQSDPDSAQKMLRTAIQTLNQLDGNEVETGNFLTNLALLMDNPDSALTYYNQAISIARQGHLDKLMIGAYNNIAYAYLDKNDVASAVEIILHQAIPLADSTKDHDWLSTLFDTYADILIKKGQYADAITWLRRSTYERTLAEKQLASRQVRGLSALLETRSKNLIILEKEQLLQRKSEHIRNLWTIAGIALATCIILIILLILHRQRSRNRMQKLKFDAARRVIEAQEHEKEKNGIELHDAIGTLSMKVTCAVERLSGDEHREAAMITAFIKEFTDSVRDMSHHLNGKTLANQELRSLLTSLCTEYIQMGNVKLNYQINEPVTFPPDAMKIHIYRIIQELLNNARKHAGTSECHLSIDFQETMITILYQDRGPGFREQDSHGKGMGLSNIFARVNLLNGTAALDTFPGKGVYWKLEIPVTNQL